MDTRGRALGNGTLTSIIAWALLDPAASLQLWPDAIQGSVERSAPRHRLSVFSPSSDLPVAEP